VAGSRRISLVPAMLTPTRLDLLDSGFGLLLLTFGLAVARRSADRMGGARFWRLCLLAGVALALAPAGRHGVPWALPLEPLALFLFGPAFLELILALPAVGAYPAARPWRRALLWLPALAALLGYAVYW